jgi:hypothetical protein
MACSLTVSSNLAISERAAASAAPASLLSRRAGRDCANAARAPSRPTFWIRMTVVGSTFHRSAAWR